MPAKAKPVIEKLHAVVRTEDGNKLTLDSGDVIDGIDTVMLCLGSIRRERLLQKLQATHQRLLDREKGNLDDKSEDTQKT